MRQAELFGLADQLKRLSDCGDPLETMSRVVNFEVFRPELEKALAYGDGARGGRPSRNGFNNRLNLSGEIEARSAGLRTARLTTRLDELRR